MIFSPQIPGRRIGAKPEWWAFREVSRAPCRSAPTSSSSRTPPRSGRDRARGAAYAGIGASRKGDQFQWGGAACAPTAASPRPTARRTSRPSRRQPRARGPTVRPRDAPRQAVQLDGAARARSAHRRRARPRAHRAADARATRPFDRRPLVLENASAASAAARSSPIRGQPSSALAGSQRADPRRPRRSVSVEPDYNAVVTIQHLLRLDAGASGLPEPCVGRRGSGALS